MPELFWLSAGLFCLIAVGFVLWPSMRQREATRVERTELNVLLYEDRMQELIKNREDGEIGEAQYRQLEEERQAALLSEVDAGVNSWISGSRLPVTAAAMIVVFAVFAYSEYGLSFGALNDLQLAREIQQSNPHDMPGMRLTVEKLSLKMIDQPDNDQGWFLLAQSWRLLSEYGHSAEAFRHLADRYPADASIAAQYAETLFLAEDKKFTVPVKEAIERALGLDGDNLLMLELSAMSAWQQGDENSALALFTKALETGIQGERAVLLQQTIERLQAGPGQQAVQGQQAGPGQIAGSGQQVGSSPQEDSGQQAAPIQQSPASDSEDRIVQVLVEVAPGVDAGPKDTVYVYARAFNGPPMPLAVQRLAVAGLPALITLTSSQAMIQGMSLSDVDKVQLVARISSSGIANASPDDYEVLSGEVDITKKTGVIKLVIEEQRGG